MRHFIVYSIFIIPILLFTSKSHAFFHLETGIGYNRGHYQTNKIQGIGLNAKTGFEVGTFFIFADVGYHDLQLGSTPTSKLTDTGITIGKDFRGWRFWYTYIMSATLSIESGSTTTDIEGDGMKLGISGKVANSAHLNLEARFIDFKESNSSPVTEFMDAGFLSISWVLW
ncbi:MAG: hypothetical protein KDD58_11505 [Bdellovibrionales bacterium]|nr:hypothetical protein [Bdellovibrionales bacterium]